MYVLNLCLLKDFLTSKFMNIPDQQSSASKVMEWSSSVTISGPWKELSQKWQLNMRKLHWHVKLSDTWNLYFPATLSLYGAALWDTKNTVNTCEHSLQFALNHIAFLSIVRINKSLQPTVKQNRFVSMSMQIFLLAFGIYVTPLVLLSVPRVGYELAFPALLAC